MFFQFRMILNKDFIKFNLRPNYRLRDLSFAKNGAMSKQYILQMGNRIYKDVCCCARKSCSCATNAKKGLRGHYIQPVP